MFFLRSRLLSLHGFITTDIIHIRKFNKFYIYIYILENLTESVFKLVHLIFLKRKSFLSYYAKNKIMLHPVNYNKYI